MKILRLIYVAISIMIACVSCIRQRDVEVTQTFCVENQTNDTWFVQEVVLWAEALYVDSWRNALYVDSASLQVAPMQSDSVSFYFKFQKGGAIIPFYAPYETLYLWYTRRGCWIETKLVNQNTQECYTWREVIYPSLDDDFIPMQVSRWKYVGEEREIRNTDYHTYKCVINQELLVDSLRDYSDNIDKE